MACSRSGQDAILADEELLDAIGSTDLGDQLDDLGVPVTSIASDDEEGACRRALISLQDGISSALAGQHLPSAPSGMESRMLVTKDSL